MADKLEASADVEIASLKKQQVRARNLMEAGPGTPWEDRGSLGTIPALFKTAFGAMFAPRKLLDSMRRLESRADARALAIAYGVIWGLAWLVHDVVSFYTSKDPADEAFDMAYHGYAWVVHFALGVAGTFFVLQFSSQLFYKLVSAGGQSAHVPEIMVYNVFAYCLGPSLVALIPFGIGPAVAVAWIFGLVMLGAVARLGVKPGNAAVCGLIALGGVVAGAVVIYFALRWVVGYLALIPKPVSGPVPFRLPGGR